MGISLYQGRYFDGLLEAKVSREPVQAASA